MADLGGVPVHVSDMIAVIERVQHSRSPSRAKRRAARGFPQHCVVRPVRKVLQLGGAL